MTGIYLIENFLTPEECKRFIKQINEDAYDPKNNFTNAGIFFNQKHSRQKQADNFFDLIPKNIVDKLNINRANKWIMTGKYFPGQKFGLHTDTGLYFSLKNKEKSKYTMLIYLNDNFNEGETIFYNDKFEETERITPVTGMALIFDIDLWHQGMEIKNGEKYWIGCELIGKF